MRLTLAALVFATAAAAHESSLNSRGHDAHAKRIRRGLTTVNASQDVHVPLRIRFSGDHDLADVPDDLDNDEDHGDADKTGWADDPAEDWEADFVGEYQFDPKDNGTTPVITDRELMEEQARELAAYEAMEKRYAEIDAHGLAHDVLVKRGLATRSEIEGRQSYRKKIGLAWTNDVSNECLKAWQGKNIWGIYSWGPYRPPTSKKYGIPWMSTLARERQRDQFKKSAKPGFSDGYVMGPNECNHPGQANLSPGKAGYLMRTYVLPTLKWNLQCIGPSIAASKNAVSWMKEYKRLNKDVWDKCPYVNVHYYGTDINVVIKWLNEWRKAFPEKRVIITEFACYSFSGKPACTKQQTVNFFRGMVNWCKANDCLAVLPFASFVNSKVGITKTNALYADNNCALSSLGKQYLTM